MRRAGVEGRFPRRLRATRGGNSCDFRPFGPVAQAGYTIVEILIATTLAMMLMAAVAQMFGTLGNSVANSRSILETADRLRTVEARLQLDLEGTTATMLPPRPVASGEGYFEYIEGSGTFSNPPSFSSAPPIPTDSTLSTANTDTTVGQMNDILMFTTHSTVRPFTGRYYGPDPSDPTGRTYNVLTIQSDTAEVAWFTRGHTLYRRVLLVVPNLPLWSPAGGFYASNDISVRNVNGTMVANSLADLTRRECRYAHGPLGLAAFPYTANWGVLGLPTLRECSCLPNSKTGFTGWIAGAMTPGMFPATTISTPSNPVKMDYWSATPLKAVNDAAGGKVLMEPAPGVNCEAVLGYSSGTRLADDVVLTNVIGFDVKAWDPAAGVYNPTSGSYIVQGAYVDLGAYDKSKYLPIAGTFAAMLKNSGLLDGSGNPTALPTYDTWSTSYETIYGNYNSSDPTQPSGPGRSYNGFDNLGIGVVNSTAELTAAAPFPIRCAASRSRFASSSPTAARSAK